MGLLGLDWKLYALALVVSVLVGALAPHTGEGPRPIRPLALVLGFLVYVALVVVSWARGRPVKRA